MTGFFEHVAAEMPYVVYVPKGVQEPMPAILFLHGMGESGDDGLKQVIQGIGSAILWDRTRFPFLVIMPQKPSGNKLWPEHKDQLNAILKKVEKDYKIDPHKRYITGLSQGGNGTFVLAKKLAWQFAAAAPICGWCDPEQAAKDFIDLPIWAFHGDADTAVKVEGSINAIEAIKKAGGETKFTIYPGVGHNSWDKAYREEHLGDWFLQHSHD